MKNFKKLSVMLFALAMGSLLTISCKKDKDITPTGPKLGNIVEVASENPDFSILVEAVKRANLVDVLSSSGPYTVFAPTNAAFESLLADLGLSSLDDISVSQLKSILLYHVISKKVPSGSVVTGYVSTNADGPDSTKLSLYINKSSSDIKLDNTAKITKKDIEASNGVIHGIDKVLIIPSNILQLAERNPSFSLFVAAVKYADLSGTLDLNGPFTVFAPSNAAFEALLTSVGNDSITQFPQATIKKILSDHIVFENITSKKLMNGNLKTLGGNDIIVSGVGTTPKLNSTINISSVDIQGTNGVLHIIDKVIFN
ncbi:MAG TPA: fasciclin domain-containing protein [Chitinophagales bacterium]|nr:fasciclin domain-containing protein [Chitinophagales bacterium]